MNQVPLVRVRYADSFAQALNQLGAPTSRLLTQVGLSEDILAVADGFMPVNQLWRFTSLASSYTGIGDFGLRSGLVPLDKHSQFGHKLLFAPNLYQAMQMFCQMARSELSNADFQIRQKQGETWFCGGAVEGDADEIQQVELYRIGMMVQVIRWAAGEDWQIDELELQSLNENNLLDTPLISNTNVTFGCPMSAIRVPEALLSKSLAKLTGSIEAGYSIDRRMPVDIIDNGFEAAIKEVIRTQVLSQRINISHIAVSLDMPVRSLQRHLANSGTCYQQLLDQSRTEIAAIMLQDKFVKLHQIADELGYSEHAHFTRAFKRIMGLSPRAYRKLNFPE